jgi:hypothetical protein
MSEPRLEDISDYNTLKGEKKKVVYAVILAFVSIAVVYAIAVNYYDSTSDNVSQDKSYKVVPKK